MTEPTRRHYNFIICVHTKGDTTIADMKVVDAFAIQSASLDDACAAAEEHAYEQHGPEGKAYLSTKNVG